MGKRYNFRQIQLVWCISSLVYLLVILSYGWMLQLSANSIGLMHFDSPSLNNLNILNQIDSLTYIHSIKILIYGRLKVWISWMFVSLVYWTHVPDCERVYMETLIKEKSTVSKVSLSNSFGSYWSYYHLAISNRPYLQWLLPF